MLEDNAYAYISFGETHVFSYGWLDTYVSLVLGVLKVLLISERLSKPELAGIFEGFEGS